VIAQAMRRHLRHLRAQASHVQLLVLDSGRRHVHADAHLACDANGGACIALGLRQGAIAFNRARVCSIVDRLRPKPN